MTNKMALVKKKAHTHTHTHTHKPKPKPSSGPSLYKNYCCYKCAYTVWYTAQNINILREGLLIYYFSVRLVIVCVTVTLC